MEQRYRYFAFISYSSDNLKEAWALKKKLDGYKLPALLCKQYDRERKPTHEAFLDKTNIQPGDLTQGLKDKLDSSHYLIVVCSIKSAESKYVTAEIEHFTRNGRENEMFLYIIESNLVNIEDCFNSAIKEAEKRWSERDGVKREILGVNIREKDVDKMFFLYRWPIIGSWLQRERAYMQLISKLLNLEFEQLWSYQRIRLAEKIVTWVMGIILVAFLLIFTWYLNQPVDVRISLSEQSVHNEELPPLNDAIVTMVIGDKTEVDTIHSVKDIVLFKEIAHEHLDKEVRLMVACQDFLPIDTMLMLSKDVLLNIRRNPKVYGNVNFRVWNPEKGIFVRNINLEIAGQKVVSDNDGRVSLFVPLKNQKIKYSINSSVPLTNDTIYMPCGPNDIVEVR